MEMKQKSANLHLGGADGVRAFACLAVVFHHLSQRLWLQNPSPLLGELHSFFLAGSAGVSVFFVLSGFLLAFPFWRRYLYEQSYPSIKHYIVRRAARIMPGYYIAFIVTTIIVLSFQLPMEHRIARFLAGLVFASGFHYITLFPTEINGPLWSISFEIFCYLIMPLFMYGLFRWVGERRSFWKGLLYWCGVFILILAANQLVHILFTPGEEGRGWQYGLVGGAKYWVPYYNPIGFFGHFAIGIIAAGICAQLFQKANEASGFKRSGWFDIICLVSMLLTLLLIWFTRHVSEFSISLQNQPYLFPILAILIAAILCTAPHSRFTSTFLDNRFFRFTAKISFGLYVWHYLIISVIFIVSAHDKDAGIDNLGLWTIFASAVLIISYFIAALSYYFIEKPVLDRAHERRPLPKKGPHNAVNH